MENLTGREILDKLKNGKAICERYLLKDKNNIDQAAQQLTEIIGCLSILEHFDIFLQDCKEIEELLNEQEDQ
jgi:hypothetical protein